MTRFSSSIVLVAAAALSLLLGDPSTAAPIPPDGTHESAESLYRFAGLERQIPMLGAQIEAEMRNAAPGVPAATLDRASAAVQRAFAPARLKSEILGELRQAWNPRLATETLRWLRSPLGRQVTQMEEDATKPEAIAAVARLAESFATSPPDARRVDLIRRLDRATGATDVSLAVVTTLARTVASFSAQAQSSPGSMAELDAALRAEAPNLRRGIEAQTLVTMLYTYRDLPTEQLAAYVAFYDSPAGRWYSKTVGSAFRRSMEGASERFGAEFATLLP